MAWLAGVLWPVLQAAAASVAIPLDLPPTNAAYAVTIVIEDAASNRVRNLTAAAAWRPGDPFPTWDGKDDTGNPLPAGAYHWRGLYHHGLDARFAFSAYNAGRVPWRTERAADGIMGGWGADHTGPSDVTLDPAGKDPRLWLSFIGQEGGSWMMTVDTQGRKTGEDATTWNGGQFVAVDSSFPQTMLYYAVDEGEYPGKPEWTVKLARWDATWSAPRLVEGGLREAYDPAWGKHNLRGLAAWGGRVFVALNQEDRIAVYVVNGLRGTLAHERDLALAQPGDLTFDRTGLLWAIAGTNLVQLDPATGATNRTVSTGLVQPQAVAVDTNGTLYVGDAATCQVHAYSPAGARLRTFGVAGGRPLGRYVPEAIGQPRGLAIDAMDRLWVAEAPLLPKRFSLWDAAAGTFVREFLGPPRYGGTATLDPRDSTRLLYAGLEFAVDWATHRVRPAFWHGDGIPDSSSAKSTAQVLHRDGHEYLASLNGGTYWLQPLMLHRRDPATRRYVPAMHVGLDHATSEAVVWSDGNGDGAAQTNEQQRLPASIEAGQPNVIGYTFLAPDLAVYGVGNWAWQRFSLWQLLPQSIDARGVPYYDLAQARELLHEVPAAVRTAGLELLWVDAQGTLYLRSYDGRPGNRGWLWAMNPAGRILWSLPLLSEGHVEYNVALPAGNIIHIHKLAGMTDGPVGPVGRVFCPVTADGQRHFVTADGLYVGAVFRNPKRDGGTVTPTAVTPGDSLNAMACPDEQWGDHLVQTADGRVVLLTGLGAGAPGAVGVTITGWDQVKRLAGGPLTLSETAATPGGKEP